VIAYDMNSSSDTSRKWHDLALTCHLGCIVVTTNASIIATWIGMTFQFTIGCVNGCVTIFVTNRDMHNYLDYVG
jgi:hypothetical protein